jgi:hypothetical protein
MNDGAGIKQGWDHVVFSIATNGYEQHFKSCLESQRDYCRRLGVPHALVCGAPPRGISAGDSAWLKIPMMGHLLQRVKMGVLYLDAECEIMPGAPDFRSLGGPTFPTGSTRQSFTPARPGPGSGHFAC